MKDLNIYMLLAGLRTAEQYEREITERMIDRDQVGPGERAVLCSLKLAASKTAREFTEEIATRSESRLPDDGAALEAARFPADDRLDTR